MTTDRLTTADERGPASALPAPDHTRKQLMNANFFLLWQGQLVSNIGTQGFNIALIFWIKHVTDSAALLGLVLMMSSLAAVITGPVGGAVADRYSRRWIIILCDAFSAIAVLSLAAVFFFNAPVSVAFFPAVCLVSVIIAVLTAFYRPAVAAAIPDLVEAEHVVKANSAYQASVQISMFIGQSLAGVIFRLAGAPLLFLLDGLSYVYAAISKGFIRIPQVFSQVPPSGSLLVRFFKEMNLGLQYVRGNAGMKSLFFAFGFLNFFFAQITALLPFYVEDSLAARIDWYGFLAAGFGVGTLVGNLIAGGRRFSGPSRTRAVSFALLLFSLMCGLLGMTRTPGMALAVAVVAGIHLGFINVNVVTLIQLATPGEIRGRVFGLMMTMTSGLAPLGMGLGGLVADLTHKKIAGIYMGCGAIMMALTLMTLMSKPFRSFLAFTPEPLSTAAATREQ